jgi:DNA-binding LacI/PurR family transcriptional regulator
VGRVTLQTVADLVGVSRMTVSNAFSRPDQLSAALRTRILAAARELGYVGPDPSARALARGRVGAIGILLTESVAYAFADEVATGFLEAIAQELAPSGTALTLLTSSHGGDVVPARDVAMDGAIVYSCDMRSDDVDWLVKRGLPMVYVDQPAVPGVPSVNIDDRGGARAAAEHLVELGHREVGLVVLGWDGPYGILDGPVDSDHLVTRQRLSGWTEALAKAGITPTVVRLPHGPTLTDTGREAGRMLLELDPRPTAVLCFSDVLANGVVHAAEDLGLRVPDDLSVVGYDDSALARRMRPTLTTVRQPIAEKGRAASAALLASLEQARGVAAPRRARHLVLPTELVVRDSTAPPPALH